MPKPTSASDHGRRVELVVLRRKRDMARAGVSWWYERSDELIRRRTEQSILTRSALTLSALELSTILRDETHVLSKRSSDWFYIFLKAKMVPLSVEGKS